MWGGCLGTWEPREHGGAEKHSKARNGLLLRAAGLGAPPGPKAGTPESGRKALQARVLNDKEETPGHWLSCRALVLGVLGLNPGLSATEQSTSQSLSFSPELPPTSCHQPCRLTTASDAWQTQEVQPPGSPQSPAGPLLSSPGQQLLPYHLRQGRGGPQLARILHRPTNKLQLPATPWVGLVGGNRLLPVSPPPPQTR